MVKVCVCVCTHLCDNHLKYLHSLSKKDIDTILHFERVFDMRQLHLNLSKASTHHQC